MEINEISTFSVDTEIGVDKGPFFSTFKCFQEIFENKHFSKRFLKLFNKNKFFFIIEGNQLMICVDNEKRNLVMLV